MQDRITSLCSKLVRAEDPKELAPVAHQLKQAIRERVDSVREYAVELALLDQLVDGDAFCNGKFPRAEESNRN